ncbi:MAG: hypothetical protein ACJ8NS_15055 [Chthoniobacterales bacterium]
MNTPDELKNKEKCVDRVSLEERYKFVTSQLVYCNEKILQSFTFFLKLISTLAGGVIWLRLQPNSAVIWSQIRSLAAWLLGLAGVGAILMIYRYVRTWWGFRKAESHLTAGAVPRPRFPHSCQMELYMMLVIGITTYAGIRFLHGFQ